MNNNYFTRIIHDIGEAGVQLTGLEATEGSAGNISVFVRELRNLAEEFTARGELILPVSLPELANCWLVLTGTGRRLRDVSKYPEQNLVVLHIQANGGQAVWYAATNLHPSSEWNSHLAVHADNVRRREVNYHALVHAQPHYLTYLSHHPDYATSAKLSNRLLRWEPETIVTFPEGLGLIPFQVPGSAILMEHTVNFLQDYRLVVWQKHGVMARSEKSASNAADLIEYAETAARYETLNLRLGMPAYGLTNNEVRSICAEFQVPFPAFFSDEPELVGSIPAIR